MIPGKDYQESFSPVAADASIKAMLAMSLFIINFGKWMPSRVKQLEFEKRYNLPACDDWTVEVFDVEAAFLNADPGMRMYIRIPEAMIWVGMMAREEAKRHAYLLTKSMYGNVDAALRFFLKYRKILLKLGLFQSESDPCVFYQ